MSTPAEKHAFRVSGETALTLLAFVVFFTAMLAWVYLFSRPVIEQSARAEKLIVLNQILPANLYNNDPLLDTLTLPAEPAPGHQDSQHGVSRPHQWQTRRTRDGRGGAGRLQWCDQTARGLWCRWAGTGCARRRAQGNTRTGRLH